MIRLASRLTRDRRGLALVEFALAAPPVLMLGLYGMETANLALANMKVSQLALTLADNASRVGVSSSISTQQLREVDIVDVFDAVRIQGTGLDVTTRGRIILSSLENKDGTQRIHWQRCLGQRQGAGWDSTYGTTSVTAGTDKNSSNDGTAIPGGMGPTGSKVTAPLGSGVMFVEVNYDYRPLLPGWMMSSSKLHYTASFIVRDRREFEMIYNPAPAVERMTCNRYTS